MKISKLLDKSRIYAELAPVNKRQLLQELSAKASEYTKTDVRLIFDALLERENLGSTGFGKGTAVPHARISGIENIFAVLAKLEKPIDFDSVDNKPIDLVFLLISPEKSGADHLTALAKISRILKDDELCSKIRKEQDIEKIYNLLVSTD